MFLENLLYYVLSNSKCVGATFYKEGGMTKERFLEANIFNKYENNLIILDNADSHNNEYVKHAIINSANKYLFSIKTNPIEQYFNQIKNFLKLNKKVLKYDELVIEIKNAINGLERPKYLCSEKKDKDVKVEKSKKEKIKKDIQKKAKMSIKVHSLTKS